MNLIKEPDSRLRTVCEAIDHTELEKYHEIGLEMLKYITKEFGDYGAGIAGPQLGIFKRIIVIAPDLICINPEIIKTWNYPIYPRNFRKPVLLHGEMCLSCGDLRLEVKRWERIRVEWTDRDGTKQSTPRGFKSVLFQHEIDHLNGITLVQRAEEILNGNAVDSVPPVRGLEDTKGME